MINKIKIVVIITLALLSTACDSEVKEARLFCGHVATAEGIAMAIGGWVKNTDAKYEQKCNAMMSKSKKKIEKERDLPSAMFGPKKGVDCSDTEDDFGYNICNSNCMINRENKVYTLRVYDGGAKKYCRAS